jgi:hypothetical protein
VPGIVRPLLAEAGAAVGAACVALHVATALAPGHGNLVARVVLLAMAVGCLPCIRGLWLAPTSRAWAMAGVMYAAMLVSHLVLLSPWTAAAGLRHGGTGPTWTDVGMWGGLGLAVGQLALVSVVLVARPGTVAASGPGPRYRAPAADHRSANR